MITLILEEQKNGALPFRQLGNLDNDLNRSPDMSNLVKQNLELCSSLSVTKLITNAVTNLVTLNCTA
jgi:hypothetical protein